MKVHNRICCHRGNWIAFWMCWQRNWRIAPLEWWKCVRRTLHITDVRRISLGVHDFNRYRISNWVDQHARTLFHFISLCFIWLQTWCCLQLELLYTCLIILNVMCEPFIWAVWSAIYMLSAKRPLGVTDWYLFDLLSSTVCMLSTKRPWT